MSNIPFTIIAAMCEKTRGIGYQGTIPWKSKEDMSFFRTTTTDVPSDEYINAVIMGRKTFESLGSRPLKGRLNVILSRANSNKDILLAKSLDDALEKISQYQGKIHLNHMKIPLREYDTFFPEINPTMYELTDDDETEDIVYAKFVRRIRIST